MRMVRSSTSATDAPFLFISVVAATAAALLAWKKQHDYRERSSALQLINLEEEEEAKSKRKQRRERSNSEGSNNSNQENEDDKDDTMPSIVSFFQDLKLDFASTTIDEANKLRTQVYYERARDAHVYDLVPGVRSYQRLRRRRDLELKRIMKHHEDRPRKSHRTVVVMCDDVTSQLLHNARTDILSALAPIVTHDETVASKDSVWIPKLNILPQEDLHVTVAIVWWWHTIRENNRALTEETAARFRQALVMEFHHAFQLELERIVLLGGRTLVALWRCIGERRTKDGHIIYDRHGEGLDPFVKLRKDIIKCFTDPDFGKEPLTYAHRIQNGVAAPPVISSPSAQKKLAVDSPQPRPTPPQRGIKRDDSIVMKTPGFKSGDGFIHTTLARLPLECLSSQDIELDAIHRLCREATANLCGHRMVVSKFRFLETIGEGGESNPCFNPIYDETIDAPVRYTVNPDGGIVEHNDLHAPKMVENNATIGAMPTSIDRGTLFGLFDSPDVVVDVDNERTMIIAKTKKNPQDQ